MELRKKTVKKDIKETTKKNVYKELKFQRQNKVVQKEGNWIREENIHKIKIKYAQVVFP